MQDVINCSARCSTVLRCIGTAVVTESRKVYVCTRLEHHVQTLSLAGDTETSGHLAGQNRDKWICEDVVIIHDRPTHMLGG